LNYFDKVDTPFGYKRILYIKKYYKKYKCVNINGCFLTPEHLVYNEKSNNEIVFAKDIGSGIFYKNVCSIVVEGDWFYANNVLVSSHTHFKFLPKISFIIDMLPLSVISFFDSYIIPKLENFF